MYQPINPRAPVSAGGCRKRWEYFAQNGQKEVVYADQLPVGMTAGDVLEARLRKRGIILTDQDWRFPPSRTYPAGYPPDWGLPSRLRR